jgi:hypothetical protein
MDRIERIGPREPTWFEPAIDPDREDIAERRRRRDEERRRREREERPAPPPEGEDPPHHIDVRV